MSFGKEDSCADALAPRRLRNRRWRRPEPRARGAEAVGATGMGCFMGSAPDRRGRLPIEAHMESTIKVLRGVRSEGLDAGVKVAIENHNGDLTAREVKTIIEEAGKDFVGSNL